MNKNKVIEIIENKEWLRLLKIAEYELHHNQTKLTEI